MQRNLGLSALPSHPKVPKPAKDYGLSANPRQFAEEEATKALIASTGPL
jgi:hypothetical protein